VTFDGVLDFEGDTYFGNVSVDEDRMDELVGDVKSRVQGYDVVPFVKGGSDE
jgi:formylmethanofuran dehydrogenase subunit A